jgi:hypothetical protein
MQAHSVFFGEHVRMFRINTHERGFLQNSAEAAAYLIVRKRYSQDILTRFFLRFVRSQIEIGNPRLLSNESNLKKTFHTFLNASIELLLQK